MGDWFDQGSGDPVDVRAVLDGQNVLDRLAAFVQAGALVSIGATSDGGALGVTITVDGRWRREYFREPSQLDDWLQDGESDIITACRARDASPVRRKRSRGL